MAGITLGVFLGLFCACWAAESLFCTEEDFERWITHYYLAPEPGKISGALDFYSSSSLFDDENTRVPMAAFFAAVFQKDPVVMEMAFADVSSRGTDTGKILMLNALWLVNNAQSRRLLDKAKGQWKSEPAQAVLERMKGQRPSDILKIPITEAVHLDMLWARFSATGDPAVIEKIISVITHKQQGSGFNMLIGGAASWSLASNAQQHPVIRALCKEALNKSTGTKKKLLEEIVKNSDTGNL